MLHKENTPKQIFSINKNVQKIFNKSFSEGFSLQSDESHLWSKIVGAFTKFLNQKQFIFEPSPIHICQKQNTKNLAGLSI